MKKNIAVLPGDGVGPEVTDEAVKVLKRVAKKFGHEFSFKEGLIGAAAITSQGVTLQEETIELCKNSDAILFGAIGDPKYDNDPKAKVRPEQGLLKLRKSLKLFANLRPIFVFPSLVDSSPLKREVVENTDFIVVRELTGGIYFGKPRGRRNEGKEAFDTSIYAEEEIIRVAKIAYDIARRQKKKVSLVDKANVLETSRLWRETVMEFAKKYPDVETQFLYVDNAAMQLIKRPSQFDVILTENMFGDILTDEASAITGSIGLLPSASIGPAFSAKTQNSNVKTQNHNLNLRSDNSQPTTHNLQRAFGLYEPIHGSYPKAAGKNIANPTGAILSASMMLKISFGMEKEANTIEKALEKVISDGWRTRDIATIKTDKKKILGTREMGEKIIKSV